MSEGGEARVGLALERAGKAVPKLTIPACKNQPRVHSRYVTFKIREVVSDCCQDPLPNQTRNNHNSLSLKRRWRIRALADNKNVTSIHLAAHSK